MNEPCGVVAVDPNSPPPIGRRRPSTQMTNSSKKPPRYANQPPPGLVFSDRWPFYAAKWSRD